MSSRLGKTSRFMPLSIHFEDRSFLAIGCTCTDNHKSSAVADMLPKRLYKYIRQRPPRNCDNNVSPTFDALDEGDPLELWGSYLVRRKLEWLRYNMVKVGR